MQGVAVFRALALLILLSFGSSWLTGCSYTGLAIGPNTADVRAGIPLN